MVDRVYRRSRLDLRIKKNHNNNNKPTKWIDKQIEICKKTKWSKVRRNTCSSSYNTPAGTVLASKPSNRCSKAKSITKTTTNSNTLDNHPTFSPKCRTHNGRSNNSCKCPKCSESRAVFSRTTLISSKASRLPTPASPTSRPNWHKTWKDRIK